MDIQNISNYIEAPAKMQEDDFNDIKLLIEKYPFFQTANMLYIKAAHNIQYENINDLINKVSASIPNREILHSLIYLTEEQIIIEDKSSDKPEESDTRKEIRDRIQQRRKKRRLQKGEILNENGKAWHEKIMADFFSPTIFELTKVSENIGVISGESHDSVPEEKSELEKDHTLIDLDKEREERKAEREKRREERMKKRDESSPDEMKAEREKRREERMKKREEKFKEEKSKETLSEETEEIKVSEKDDIIDDVFSKVITLPTKEKKPEVTEDEEIKTVEEKSEIKLEETKTDEEVKIIKQESDIAKSKKQVIIEDISSDEKISGKDGDIIENIYDSIISSKKPKNGNKEDYSFIEIAEDITGLTDKDDIKEIKKTENLIKTEDEILVKDEKVDKEETVDIKDEKELKIEESTKDDIEFIVEDKSTEIEEEEEIIVKDDPILITDDKDDEFEFLDKKEDKVEEIKEIENKSEEIKLETEDKIEEKIELKEDKKEADIKTEEIVSELLKEEEKAKTVDDKKGKSKETDEKEIKEEKIIDKKEKLKETDSKADKSNAANDVFARIAAFKKKKDQSKTDIKKDDLINKFVNDTPALKRPTDEDTENIDVSEESAKEKKPVITELMAGIYINQGKYDQAIEVFEKLILKSPEKKDYFAAKIEETQKLK